MYRHTIPKFPLAPETVDAIIDQVYALNEGEDDLEKLLGVSSLVCKSWLPRSRHHLFQKIIVDRESEKWTEAKPFMDLLDSPLCTFKPCVRILDLQEDLENEPEWLEYALPRLSTLPAVRELTIEDGMFTSPNSAKVLSHFHNLQDLVLDSCSFGSAAQLFEALSICTSLKSVGLYELTISHSDSPSIVNSPPPSSLRSVHTHSASTSKDMMEWLVSGEQVPAIGTLVLNIIQADESRAIGHCFQRLGPSLKNLEIGFTAGRSRLDSENAFLRDVDLSYNINLNSICFRGSSSIPSIIAKVTSSEVQEVVVDVTWAPVGEREVDWDTVVRIMDRPNFSALKRFIIIPPERDVSDMEKWRRRMMQTLPPGRARGKLILCEEWFGYHPQLW